MLRYALFLGCNIPARVKHYESSTRAVLKRLGVGVVDIPEFKCCGYPLRNVDRKAFVLSSAENLALAEKEGHDLLVLCKCGFGTLKEAAHLLKEDKGLRREINRLLGEKGLEYDGSIQIKHLLSVLYHDVGIETLKRHIKMSYKDLKIATHYGCHALRPSKVTRFDDPVAPTLFDELVKVTGARNVDWTSRLECCGAPLIGINDDLSMTLTERKLADARQAGAHYLTTACPYCQIQFDTVQQMMVSQDGDKGHLASLVYPQLLGLCMGIDKETLGLGMNQLDITHVTSFLTQE